MTVIVEIITHNFENLLFYSYFVIGKPMALFLLRN